MAQGDEVARDCARRMSNDEWAVFATSEAAKAIGEWLEARGKLEQPIHRLTMADLIRMADSAVSRWVVLSSIRLRRRPEAQQELGWLIAD